MASTPRVAVFYAEGCHLCERARGQLARLREELGFELDEVDIGGDSALETEYRAWLPVIEIDGRRRFVYYLQEEPFRRAVEQLRERPPNAPC